jgi:hypothetical protein
MAFNEQLAERVRVALWERSGVREIRMFGGLCFTLHGRMCCGVLGDRLILRLGEEGVARALTREHTRPMDFTGRAIRSMVYVETGALDTDAALDAWISRAVGHALTLINGSGEKRRTNRRKPATRPPARKGAPARRSR